MVFLTTQIVLETGNYLEKIGWAADRFDERDFDDLLFRVLQ